MDPNKVPWLPIGCRSYFPHLPCVYVVTDEAGTVLYVGKATDVKTRWAQHHRMKELIEHNATRVYFNFVDDASELDDLELMIIRLYEPKLNRTLVSVIDREVRPPQPREKFTEKELEVCKRLGLDRIAEHVITGGRINRHCELVQQFLQRLADDEDSRLLLRLNLPNVDDEDPKKDQRMRFVSGVLSKFGIKLKDVKTKGKVTGYRLDPEGTLSLMGELGIEISESLSHRLTTDIAALQKARLAS